MSESLVSNVITALAAIFTLLVSRFFEERTRKAEREQQERLRAQDNAEWYRRALFEKRLAAVQEAYNWLMRLYVAINRVPSEQPDLIEAQELMRIAHEGRDWYNVNVLYLYDELPGASQFIGLTNEAEVFASGGGPDPDRVRRAMWDSYESVSGYIRRRAKELTDSNPRP